MSKKTPNNRIYKGYPVTYYQDGTLEVVGKRGKILKPFKSNSGYLAVDLNRQKCYLHRIIAELFIGESGGLHVNHKDGDKLNNKIDNLEYCTKSENLIHAYHVLGTKKAPRMFGKDNPNYKHGKTKSKRSS